MMTDGRENDHAFVAEVIYVSLLSNAVLWLAVGLLYF